MKSKIGKELISSIQEMKNVVEIIPTEKDRFVVIFEPEAKPIKLKKGVVYVDTEGESRSFLYGFEGISDNNGKYIHIRCNDLTYQPRKATPAESAEFIKAQIEGGYYFNGKKVIAI